jgi:hypothetical protein
MLGKLDVWVKLGGGVGDGYVLFVCVCPSLRTSTWKQGKGWKDDIKIDIRTVGSEDVTYKEPVQGRFK